MGNSREKRFVISLGGSLIAPKEGIDVPFLRRLRVFLGHQAKRGNRFVIVCGGGAVSRQYQAAASAAARPTHEQLDWIGIRVTEVNAQLVRTVLGSLAHDRIVSDPHTALRVKEPIIIASGWRPGCSTDKDAVILAQGFGAETVINLSNVSHVYDGDPRLNPSAKPIESMSWRDFRRAFGRRWSPGLNSPFDPVAAQLASRSGIRAVIADGRNLKNLGLILSGRRFQGTVIG
jgi:uridylate kinase